MAVQKLISWMLFFATILLGIQHRAWAEPFDQSKLPPELKSWVPWVLDEVPERFCPIVEGEAVCAWPGELSFELDANGGRFSEQVLTDMDIFVTLPGDAILWPQNVAVDGRAAVVLEKDGRPVVHLQKGTSRIVGEFVFNGLPEGIQIPAEAALVSLRVDGEEIQFPRRDETGMLWLQSATSAREENERLDVTVMRKLRDGIPLSIMTKIVLRVSGKSREVTLPGASLDGTIPLSVESTIPARLDKDGNLGLQVRAGTHTITIVARTLGSPELITAAKHEPPWPQDEIWVWQADEKLRQAVVSGPPGIDPSQTSLPEEWHGLPTFLAGPGAELAIHTTRRGEPEPPPDQLELERELWMDLDGDGFTVRDHLSGTLSRTWRLDLQSAGILGHVAVNGIDQLITENPATKKPGVELRKSDLNMTAEWRLEGSSTDLPALGWSEDVQSLGAVLHLPPGWTLLSASGVDELPGTWWDKWDLFGFFFVLIVSLAIAKLTRWYFGLTAFIALALSYQESDAPFIVWISLLVSVGLLKVLPKGKLRIAAKSLWWASLLWLVIVLVPFSVSQVRSGLFPQVTSGMDQATRALESAAPDFLPPTGPAKWQLDGDKDISALASNVAMARQEAEEIPPELQKQLKVLGHLESGEARGAAQAADILEEKPDEQAGWSEEKSKRLSRKGRYSMPQKALQQDPKAVVQTGPGVPAWQWKRWRLSWSGPVTKDHEIKLYLASPGVNSFLSILRVLLLALISIRIALEALPKRGGPSNRSGSRDFGKRAVATGATVLGLLLACPGVSRAGETPDSAILTEMLERLTRQEACRPDCVSTPLLDIQITDDILTLTAEVHVGARSSWQIPGPAKNWVPASVEIDGRSTKALAIRPDGFMHVRAEAGRQKIVARGQVPPGNSFAVEFVQTPHRVTASVPGWTIEGLREDGRTEGSVQITRRAQIKAKNLTREDFEEGSYPPWLEITRTLDLGIPWLVHTHVRRISPPGAPVHTRIPLLPGESVTESALQVEDGSALLSLGRNDEEINWSSTLDEQPEINLAAPTGTPWTEIWVLKCSPVWQCELEGLAPIHSVESGTFEPTFLPWPGEGLAVKLTRPGGVEGQSTTIDSATLSLEPGVRYVNVYLGLDVRSSRGGTQRITLPEGANVQELTVDGEKQPFRQEKQKLLLTLKTGRQRIDVTWQQEGGIEWLYRAPQVNIGGHAVNAKITIRLPNDRWLIWTGGPSWGPAILFWGYLLTILLAGLILGRIRLSPLRSWQWMLLALGLTQIPVPVALILVLWFFALAWRAHNPPKHFVLHNAVQIVLGIWTLVFIGCLVYAVYHGLAVQPDMQVQGCNSMNTRLIWYQDRIDGNLPMPWVISFPILVWKLIMLAWALWLAFSIVKWVPWSWRSFSAVTLWRSAPPREKNKVSSKEKDS